MNSPKKSGRKVSFQIQKKKRLLTIKSTFHDISNMQRRILGRFDEKIKLLKVLNFLKFKFLNLIKKFLLNYKLSAKMMY